MTDNVKKSLGTKTSKWLLLLQTVTYYGFIIEFQDILREHEHDNIDSFEDTMKDLPQDGELFEGDMRMDDRLRNAVLGIKRTAISDDDLRWPDGVIVYENNIQSKFSFKNYVI